MTDDIIDVLTSWPCDREPFTPGHVDCQCRRASAAAREIVSLREALRPFAAIHGIAVPRMQVAPEHDRLWSYHDSRQDVTHEITRAHIIAASAALRAEE